MADASCDAVIVSDGNIDSFHKACKFNKVNALARIC